MANELDTIALNLKDQKVLQEAVATKKIGDRCKMEVSFMITDMTSDMLTGMIDEANPVHYSGSDSDDDDDGTDASLQRMSKGQVSSGPNAADRYATM